MDRFLNPTNSSTAKPHLVSLPAPINQSLNLIFLTPLGSKGVAKTAGAAKKAD
jgi:hypothetical protein